MNTVQPAPSGFNYYLRYALAATSGAVVMAVIALAFMGRLPFNESIAGTPEGARALIESTAKDMVQVGEPALDNNRAMVYVRLAGRTCQFILLKSRDSEIYGWRVSEQSCEPKLR